jgi:hypothetical protein
MLFGLLSRFIILGIMNVTSCEWSLEDLLLYSHFNISGGVSRFKCSSMIIHPFNGNGLRLFVCNSENSILDNCIGLEIHGVSSSDYSLIELNTGISTFKNSVFFYLIDIYFYFVII